MLPHVDQSFLHNAQNLATDPLRHIQFVEVGDESRADPGLPLKAFDRVVQNPEQPLRVDIDRFHLLHQFPQLEHFLAQQSLDAAQFRADRFAGVGLPAQYVHLHFHRNQRLHGAIVQFPRKARPLGRSRPAPQPVQKINVVDRRADLVDQIQQKAQFLLLLAPPCRVE